MKSIKEKFDKKFPEAKTLREMELRRAVWKLFGKSTVGKVASVIYLIISFTSIFIYWKFFRINIFLSIFLGAITWFAITYVFDLILIKLLGIEKILTKMNDEEIKASGEKLEETLKEKGVSMDDFLK